mgnify:CR=1 FL=1
MTKVIAAILALAALAGMASAQEQSREYGYTGIGYTQFIDFNGSGFGAKSRAMGGTFMSIANDAFASFLNPATMSYTGKSLMSVEIVNSADKHEGLGELKFRREMGDYVINRIDYKAYHTKLIQAGAVAPFSYMNRDWWVGGGFRTVYDTYLKFEDPVYADAPDRYVRNHTIDALNLAIAGMPHEYITLGLNLNYYIRGYTEDVYNTEYLPDTNSSLLTDNRHLRDKSGFSGANLDIGMMFNYDRMAAGFVFRTPYTLKQEALLWITRINVYGEDDGIIDRVTVKNKIPASYGFGISGQPIDNLTLAFDYDIRPFSKTEMSFAYEAAHWKDDTLYKPEWVDIPQYRIGAEYVFDAGFAKLPIRAGHKNQRSILKNPETIAYDTLTIDTLQHFSSIVTYGKDIEAKIFTFGTGLKFEKIWFDLAYEFGSSEFDQNRSLAATSQSWSGKLKLKYSKLYASVNMLF